MRPISEFLSTKIKNTNAIQPDGFPKKPQLDLVTDFLNAQGFVSLKFNRDEDFYITVFDRDNVDQKRYICTKCTGYGGREEEYWIRFCKEGETSEKNPLYFCRLTETGEQLSKDNDMGYVEFVGRISPPDKEFSNYEEFVEYVNKVFEWT